MRIPRALNPRLKKRIWRKFGIYEIVVPEETTPSRTVPDSIEFPDYISGKLLIIPKSPEVKDAEQLEGMHQSCKIASSILHKMQTFIKPGITTDKIDELVHRLSIEAGAYPSPLHYKGFPKSVCTSVNNVAVHGIPDLRALQDGDIANVDITAIKHCGPDVPFREIGARIYRHAKRNGLTVLPAFVGHGIGKYFHGPPEIHHSKNRYPGLMKPGMTFTIEPALSHGSENTVILEDGWTVITEDGSRAAQAEHTILITEHGAEILT
ncbi:methionine aminopeptidase 1D, mitochondrial isoform X3 [Ostrinia furnacalis]|uniref:methionine aminopeptidase 1D, mitochondrial isoform X3 n=1 Tax=Ostrinia furnacalis TaxID=93504 RepID=UPI00103B8955|nr:methionine aminopeptidase 1D, mitochondrial isoform X3 [Ostrinia furnacalis]